MQVNLRNVQAKIGSCNIISENSLWISDPFVLNSTILHINRPLNLKRFETWGFQTRATNKTGDLRKNLEIHVIMHK